MTTIGQSRRLMKTTLTRASGKVRTVIALELLLDTLVLALGVLVTMCDFDFPAPLSLLRSIGKKGASVIYDDVNMSFVLPFCVYFIALISLYVQIPLARIARENAGRDVRRVSFGRLSAMLPLALPAALMAALIEGMYSWVMIEWTYVTRALFTSTASLVLSLCVVALVVLLLVMLGGFIAVFTRQLALYLAECPDRASGRAVAASLKTALKRIFSPAGLFFTALGWFLLAFALTAALVLCSCFITTPIETDMGLTMTALQLLAALFNLPAWAWAASVALGGFWMLGLGLIARPRYEMTRLYWHRLTLKERGIL